MCTKAAYATAASLPLHRACSGTSPQWSWEKRSASLRECLLLQRRAFSWYALYVGIDFFSTIGFSHTYMLYISNEPTILSCYYTYVCIYVLMYKYMNVYIYYIIYVHGVPISVCTPGEYTCSISSLHSHIPTTTLTVSPYTIHILAPLGCGLVVRKQGTHPML